LRSAKGGVGLGHRGVCGTVFKVAFTGR